MFSRARWAPWGRHGAGGAAALRIAVTEPLRLAELRADPVTCRGHRAAGEEGSASTAGLSSGSRGCPGAGWGAALLLPSVPPVGAFTTARALPQPFCIPLPRCGTDAASQGLASGWHRERFPTSPSPSLNEASSPPSHSYHEIGGRPGCLLRCGGCSEGYQAAVYLSVGARVQKQMSRLCWYR